MIDVTTNSNRFTYGILGETNVKFLEGKGFDKIRHYTL